MRLLGPGQHACYTLAQRALQGVRLEVYDEGAEAQEEEEEVSPVRAMLLEDAADCALKGKPIYVLEHWTGDFDGSLFTVKTHLHTSEGPPPDARPNYYRNCSLTPASRPYDPVMP